MRLSLYYRPWCYNYAFGWYHDICWGYRLLGTRLRAQPCIFQKEAGHKTIMQLQKHILVNTCLQEEHHTRDTKRHGMFRQFQFSVETVCELYIVAQL